MTDDSPSPREQAAFEDEVRRFLERECGMEFELDEAW